MNEELKKMLETFGVAVNATNGEFNYEELLSQLGEQWDRTVEEIKASVEPLEVEQFMTKEKVSEKLGTELTANSVLNLAKEGQEYRKQLVDETIAMGVRAMGNEFKAETWKVTLATMETAAIKDIMANFETQAKNIPAGRHTDPKGDGKQSMSIPDDAFKVGK